jgi:hypothetical protein
MKVEEMSPQQRRAEIAELLGRAMMRLQQQVVTREPSESDKAQPDQLLHGTSTSMTLGGAYE